MKPLQTTVELPSSPSRSRAPEVSGEIRLGETRYPVFFRSLGKELLEDNPETWVAASLLPVMRIKVQTLVSPREIDPGFRDGVETIQDVFLKWDPKLGRVRIESGTRSGTPGRPGGRVGLFFTGGVDSFFSLYKHLDEITDLIFVHGFDMGLGEQSLWETVRRHLQAVAESTGKQLVEIETNLRTLLDPHADWGALSHGAALASVGLLLQGTFDRIYIAATETYSALYRRGSHPLLDPNWSTRSLRFVHDGCEASRCEKIGVLVRHPLALEHLRVCFRNPEGGYNCGRCEKCLRTMISLQVHQALEACVTFESDLCLRRVSRMTAETPELHAFVLDNLDGLGRIGGNEALRATLERLARRTYLVNKIKRLWRMKRRGL